MIPMPHRVSIPTTYNWPGDIVWLLPHQVKDHHEPLPYDTVVPNDTHVQRLHTADFPTIDSGGFVYGPESPNPQAAESTEEQPGINPTDPRYGVYTPSKFVSVTDAKQAAENAEVKAEDGASTARPVEETSAGPAGSEHHN